MNISKTLISATILVISATANAEDSQLAQIFHNNHINGTIVISSLEGDIEYIHNDSRAEKRFLPASTFKIPNTLIALSEKAVINKSEIIKWDGKDKGWSPWNQDHSLETAFPVSCIWFYQELAKRVGKDSYTSYLTTLNYGNKQTGDDISNFWLEGDLKISAKEQVSFLKKLYKDELPFQQSDIDALKELMLVKKTADYELRAKSGWANRIKNQHGWYVGYVKNAHDVWFFATNINITNKSDARYRQKLTSQALAIKGIIPSS